MKVRKTFTRFLSIALASFTVYLLSYAPFVRFNAPDDPVTGSFYYRTPSAYRPVEWLTVKTGPRCWSLLLAWSQLWGARDAAEIQAWFYAQNIEKPHEMSVDWGLPD